MTIIELGVVNTLKELNTLVYRKTRRFPSDLNNGDAICFTVTKGINIDELVNIYLNLEYLRFKNNLKCYVNTRKGYRVFDRRFVRAVIDKLNVKSFNYSLPMKNNGYLNYPVFKGQLIALKKLLVVTNSDTESVWMKEASSYDGDFWGICDSTELDAQQREIRFSHIQYIDCKINVLSNITNVVTKQIVQHLFKLSKLSYSINGSDKYVRFFKEYHPERDEMVHLVKYLFSYDEKILYNESGEYTTKCIDFLANQVVENPTVWFDKNFRDESEFVDSLTRFLTPNFGVQTAIYLADHVAEEMKLHDRFIEDEVFYEDTYNEDEE